MKGLHGTTQNYVVNL